MSKKNAAAAKKLNLSAPWHIYRNKIAALFSGDSDIIVGQIDKTYTLTIEVKNKTKLEILEKYLPENVSFGNVILTIELAAYEFKNEAEEIGYLLGNTKAFVEILDKGKSLGHTKPYAQFVPFAIQFYADDTSDANGSFNGLMADIAKEVLGDAKRYVYFSTAKNPVEFK